MIFIDDSYGQGYAQSIQNHAAKYNVDVVVAQSFSQGNQQSVNDAIREVREAGTHVTFCIAFATEIESIATAATREGIVGRGYTWITGCCSPLSSALCCLALQHTRRRAGALGRCRGVICFSLHAR